MTTTDNIPEGQAGAEQQRDRVSESESIPASPSFHLRLWLPGYHTPSGNQTVGKHWSKVYRMKKAVAGHLLGALGEVVRSDRGRVGVGGRGRLPERDCCDEAVRILTKIAMGVRLETRRGKKAAKPAVPARLRFERVTVSLCDEDNFKAGTKALVDCLRYAFPTVLLDDAPGYVVMEHVQKRCAKRCEEGTWVELAAAGPEAGRKEAQKEAKTESSGPEV